MHQNLDHFECKQCNQVVDIAYREFYLRGESSSTQYYEPICLACVREFGLQRVEDPILREVLAELSDIAGYSSIRLASPGSYEKQHGVSNEDLETDITDVKQPHKRRRRVDSDEDARYYAEAREEIQRIKGEQAMTPSESLGYRCKSNQESEHKFPLRSNWRPSEVPDSMESYRRRRLEEIDEWAKYRLNPDGTFSKDGEEK